jgi:hypothetical protein
MIFNKDTKFDTEKEFKTLFPMFKNTKIVLNPFSIINTNGACIIFKTIDKSHFIFTTSNNTCYLIGASQELLDSCSVPWVMKNVLDISVAYTRISTKSCAFTYEGKKYVLITKDCHKNVSISLSLEN